MAGYRICRTIATTCTQLRAMLAKLPASVDLRSQCPKEVYDQGQLGSCARNAIAGAIEFEEIKSSWHPKSIGQRFHAFAIVHLLQRTRPMGDNYVTYSAVPIRLGIKSAVARCATESLWPYDIANFAEIKWLSAAAFTAALQHRVLLYQRLPQNLDQMKACLALGYPFVFGFTVYESFES